MKRGMRVLPILGLGLLLTACASAPTHFYTLVPPDTVTSAASAPSAPYRIAVLPVTVPAQVDQPQMVVREGDSAVSLLEGERWIAPLGDEIRAALAGDLAGKLHTQDVYGLASEGKPVYRVKLDVNRFESVPGRYTLLGATWSIRAMADKGKVTQCASTVRESVPGGYAALAQGHQRGLQSLANGMASVIRAMAQGHTANCPNR